ncbi:histidine kinase [Curtobacterium sp. L3-7]|uniref:sensor histidine kinase n=1 Tax=Curtobacterium sp. L3-7 TaxID=3138787 RepID=UPI003B52F3C7
MQRRREPMAWLRGPSRRRLVVIAAGAAAYFVGLAVALHLAWYPQGLPGYVFFGVAAAVAAATCVRWPLETLTNLTAFTAYVCLAPLPEEMYGLYVRPPEALVPLALVTFLMISNGGPVFAPAATFGTLSVLTIVPWKDVVQLVAERRPWSEAALIDSGTDRSVLLGELIGCALVVLVAVMLRRQRRVTAQLAEQNRELTRLQAATIAHAAERERTRVAREVHDEVAHHVAALVIHAQSSLRIADRDPGQLVDAMRVVAEGGQDVLARIRSVVRVLRVPPETAPVLGSLADELLALAERIRAIGYDVDSTVTVRGEVPERERTAVLGIVQESLTNVMLHSSARTICITVQEQQWSWTIDVTDPGPKQERFPTVPRGGSGIPSMRERVGTFGGTLVAGPTEDGSGWSVSATIPMLTPSKKETTR